MVSKKALIIVENNTIPVDRRVWYEATALRDDGWQVSVICPQDLQAEGQESERNLEGIQVYNFVLHFAEKGIASYLKEYTAAIYYLSKLSWKVWRKSGFDIIQICNPPDFLFPIGLFYRILGAKFIFDHHDLFSESIAWRFKGAVGKVLYVFDRICEALTFKTANLVLSTNETYKKIAIERGRIPESKVRVIRNGPKINEFTEVTPFHQLKRGFKYMVAFVGFMGSEDGIHEAATIIRHVIIDLDRKDILFTFVGDGSERQMMQDLFKTWGLEEWLDLPGFVRDDHLLRQYMSTADLFISPEPPTPMNSKSTFIKIGEYMAIGRPIVAFDLCETHFTAQDAAVYLPANDFMGFAKAIVDLLDHPDQRKEMGEYGRQRVVEYIGWEYQKQKYLEAYHDSLRRGSSSKQ